MLSRLPKIGAFTLLSLSIAACSSNNHNNNSISAHDKKSAPTNFHGFGG